MISQRTAIHKPDWNLTKDMYFVELLSDECCLARKPVGGLSKDAWQKVVQSLTLRYRSFYQRDKLVNRKRVLMDHYKLLSYIMNNSSGFGWKDHKLEAPENVWSEMIAKKPQVKGYRDKLLPSYDRLQMIFKEGFADGRSSMAPVEAAEVLPVEGARSSSRTDQETHRPESSDSSDGHTSQPPPTKRSRPDNSSKGSTKKDRDIEAIGKLTNAVEKFTETFAETAKLASHTPFCDVLAALELTEGISDVEYTRAVTLLASDRNLGDAFVVLPLHRRLGWLRSLPR